MHLAGIDPDAPLPDWALVLFAIIVVLAMVSSWGFRRMVERSMRPPEDDDKKEGER
jgi:membrane protein implicated in regulation of membrane protease activity